MNISIAVCDDLEEERFSLVRMIQHYAKTHQLNISLDTAASGEEFLSMWKPDRWDLVFLDIYMAGLTGEEVARRIREVDRTCTLVFATTSQDHGIVGHELRVSDYLVKPFQQQDVDSVLDWVLQEHFPRLRTIRLYADWEEVEMRVRDITYIEIREHTALIHANGRVVSTRRGIESLEEELGGLPFFRCHRSYLVNLKHVDHLQKRDFYMDDGALVPISLHNLSQAKQLCLELSLEKSLNK